jgi:hypothetical protein
MPSSVVAVGNNKKSSEALKIVNEKIEKKRSQDSISPSLGPTYQLIKSGWPTFCVGC